MKNENPMQELFWGFGPPPSLPKVSASNGNMFAKIVQLGPLHTKYLPKPAKMLGRKQFTPEQSTGTDLHLPHTQIKRSQRVSEQSDCGSQNHQRGLGLVRNEAF